MSIIPIQHRREALRVSDSARGLLAALPMAFAIVAAGLVYFGCADAERPAVEPGLEEGEVPRNVCGGTTLFVDIPGGPCGACLAGRWECANPESLQCVGDRAANACGGCLPLNELPSEPCGCNGVWECDGADGVRCTDARPRNLCGGCEELGPAQPGFACLDGAGTWACETAERTICVAGATNACGGTGPLTSAEPGLSSALPGQPCGPCGLGTVVCDPDAESTLRCVGGTRGVNACGGCGILPERPGAVCGCGGALACAPGNANLLVCQGGDTRNACGGCEPLATELFSPCAGEGVTVCAGPESTRCAAPGAGICGENSPDDSLPAPGVQCGSCGDGVTVCSSDARRVCAGASEVNACGGCGELPGLPGDACATGRIWRCTDGGQMTCAPTLDTNRCGGTAALSATPGDVCGACEQGTVVCISIDRVACLGGSDTSENPCGGCNRLDGVPGQPCGQCLTGILVCDGVESLRCEGEIEDAAFPLYFDRDGDGFGDPTSREIRCPETPGWVRDRSDCNDILANTYPGAPELCDGLDNDCNGVVDDPFLRYRDQDLDGFGTGSATERQCELRPGYATVGGDCDDTDAQAFPGQLLTFSRPRRGAGGWDFDCNGVETLAWPDPGQCDRYPSCDGIGVDTGDFLQGYLGEIPPCGQRATFLTDCGANADTLSCGQRVEERAQECR